MPDCTCCRRAIRRPHSRPGAGQPGSRDPAGAGGRGTADLRSRDGSEDILDIGTPEKHAYAQEWFAAHPCRDAARAFLDRDGVILHALPRGEYLTDWSQSRLVDGIESLVGSAQAAGYLTVVVTNQPQVSRGLISEDKLRAIHDRMAAALDGRLDAIYYCPHTDKDGAPAASRRPACYYAAASDLEIDLERSLMVGDSDRDVLAGSSAGCRTVFIRNEYNARKPNAAHPESVVNNLSEIVPLL